MNARSIQATTGQRLALALGVAALSAASGARADISQVPLTLASSVEPNIVLSIDDSGSMDFELLLPTDDGAAWWSRGERSFGNGSGVRTGGTDRRYIYLFPNGTGAGNKMYDNSTSYMAVPPVPEFGFTRSADYNAQYYDPALTYRPWVSRGGVSFDDADPANAASDPVDTGNRFDLTAEVYRTDYEWQFGVSQYMRRPDDVVSNSSTYGAFRYYPATYYQRTTASITYTLDGDSFNCNTPDPAAHDYYEANRPSVQSTLEAAGFHSIAPDGHCLVRYEIKSGNSFPSGRSYADEIQNFANWFTYHRKRHLALRAGLGAVFDATGAVRIGGFTINDRDDVTMWDMDTDKASLYDFMYGIGGSNGGTPNRQALKFAGDQFEDNGGIITHACQQNFVLHFTDGFTDVPGSLSSTIGVGNVDGGEGSPYQDGWSNTIADIALRNYQGPFRDGTFDTGKVPVPVACSTATPPAWLDCNDDLHAPTYAVTLGTLGTIFGQTHLNVQDAHATPPAWPDPNDTKDQEQVDDLYHAAVNGRGEMLNARSTAELKDALDTALRAILGSVVSSASVVSSNSTRLDTETLVYQARFDSGSWSGELLAFGLGEDGSIGTLEWDAGLLIPAPAGRGIYTRNAAGNGISFEWAALDPAQQAALDTNAAGTTDGLGQERLAWLRGARDDELASGGALRTRTRLLGDIVNSSPWFVGAQNFGYERLPEGAAGHDSYQAFRLANESRRKMIYVGANDGMLHAFDAETGIEQFAYVPSELIPELVELTDPAYRHRYYVDGTAVAGDAFFGGGWKTVLVGSTGAGGRSVFALDVTDPDAFGASKVLWEFTDADLGSVIGRPSIARMANGRWAAIFGSGYGLDKSAKLFVVDLENGSLLAKLSTVRSSAEASAVANGMGPPFPADVDGDTITDIVYAGDLYGNLWKFDVGASGAGSWAAEFSAGSPPAPRPLVTVCASGDVAGPFACPAADRQPITLRPVVGRGRGDSLMVYFGTGKFFETTDNSVTGSGPVQSFYGIQDDHTTTGSSADDRLAGRSELQEQEILAEVDFDDETEVRVTTANSVPDDKRGWYLDLVSPVNGFEGERVVAQPLLREGRLIFTTLIPSSDACEGGGSSWLMELAALDGGRFDYPVFDLDGDGLFTDDDLVTVTLDDGTQVTVPASGRRSEVGVIQTPAIIEAGAVEYKIAGGSTGGIESVRERGRLSKGRNSWRQLWPGQ